MKLGFTCFTRPTQPSQPTLRQQVVALSDAKRIALLNAYEMCIPVGQLDHKLGLSQEIIDYVFTGIDNFQIRSRSFMRGEVLLTPEVSHLDPVTGLKVIDTPAVYNVVPTTQVQLRDLVKPEFLDDFPAVFINLISDEMFRWSKFDGTGTFNFYKTNIIL